MIVVAHSSHMFAYPPLCYRFHESEERFELPPVVKKKLTPVSSNSINWFKV